MRFKNEQITDIERRLESGNTDSDDVRFLLSLWRSTKQELEATENSLILFADHGMRPW